MNNWDNLCVYHINKIRILKCNIKLHDIDFTEVNSTSFITIIFQFRGWDFKINPTLIKFVNGEENPETQLRRGRSNRDRRWYNNVSKLQQNIRALKKNIQNLPSRLRKTNSRSITIEFFRLKSINNSMFSDFGQVEA